MKKIYGLLTLLTVLIFCSSCNDEWKEEQFKRYVSFKAPIDSKVGVTPIYVRFKANENTTYKLPVIVSGSTTNDQDLTVHVGIDVDTLKVLNFERFQNREDFYFKQLTNQYFSIPKTVDIKTGQNVSLMDINFSLKGIDLVDKWVLPVTVLDNPSYDYVSNPRKHYKKALLRVMPFNDFSGSYSGTRYLIKMKARPDETPIVKSVVTSYVVDENTVFFYAGNMDEDRKDRANYKIYATFTPTAVGAKEGTVKFSANNPAMKFTETSYARYAIREEMDAVRPYLMHRYLVLSSIGYEFTDYTMVPGVDIDYTVNGTLIMERKLNTQIPDEEQAIEW